MTGTDERARRSRLRGLAPLALVLAVLVAIAVVAELDHAHKRAMGNAAQLSEWYCAHRGERCGGPDSDRIQHRWEAREVAYKAAFGLVAASGIVLLVSRYRQPR